MNSHKISDRSDGLTGSVSKVTIIVGPKDWHVLASVMHPIMQMGSHFYKRASVGALTVGTSTHSNLDINNLVSCSFLTGTTGYG